MEFVTLEEFDSLDEKRSNEVQVDLDTVPPFMKNDFFVRNENIRTNRELCWNCDGTGNEFLTKYHKCSECEGKGYQARLV